MRTNLILLVLAVVLAFFTAMTVIGEQMELTKIKDIPQLFPGFSPDAVMAITITKKKAGAPQNPNPQAPPEQQFEQLVFVRQEGGWYLKSTTQDPKLVDLKLRQDSVERDILRHLEALRFDQETLVTADADEKFLEARDLTQATGTIIVCLGAGGAKQARAIKGAKSDRGKTDAQAIEAYYVCRLDNPKEVVLYEPEGLFWRVSLDANDWIETTIHQFQLSEVESFSIRNAQGQVAFTKKKGSDATWVVVDEKTTVEKEARGAVRQGEVTNLVTQFQTLRAHRFTRGKVAGDETATPLFEVSAILKGGELFQMRVLWRDQAEPYYEAIASHSRFRFQIPDHAVSPYGRDPEDLFDPR